jgi:hypothetical protein
VLVWRMRVVWSGIGSGRGCIECRLQCHYIRYGKVKDRLIGKVLEVEIGRAV